MGKCTKRILSTGKINMSKKFKEMAKKALEEAKKRKKSKSEEKGPKEINGPAGPEPTRYGDWEKKGIVSDF